MRDPVWMLAVAAILEAVVMMLLPNLSPRHIFFGVRTGAEFRATDQGRRVLVRYRGQLFGWTAVSLFIVLGMRALPEGILGITAMFPLLGGLIGFFRSYFQVRPHELPPDQVREAELAPSDGRVPWWS